MASSVWGFRSCHPTCDLQSCGDGVVWQQNPPGVLVILALPPVLGTTGPRDTPQCRGQIARICARSDDSSVCRCARFGRQIPLAVSSPAGLQSLLLFSWQGFQSGATIPKSGSRLKTGGTGGGQWQEGVLQEGDREHPGTWDTEISMLERSWVLIQAAEGIHNPNSKNTML